MDVTKLIAVIRAVAAAMLPGSTEAIAAGEAVYELVKSVAPTLASDDQKALQAALPALLAKLDHDVDAAIAALTKE